MYKIEKADRHDEQNEKITLLRKKYRLLGLLCRSNKVASQTLQEDNPPYKSEETDNRKQCPSLIRIIHSNSYFEPNFKNSVTKWTGITANIYATVVSIKCCLSSSVLSAKHRLLTICFLLGYIHNITVTRTEGKWENMCLTVKIQVDYVQCSQWTLSFFYHSLWLYM